MKLNLPWLKLDTSLNTDPRIDALVSRYGHKALGLFILLLVTVGRECDETGALRSEWTGGETDLAWLARQLLCDLKALPDYLSNFADLGLISPTRWLEHIVAIPNILKWNASYMQLRNNGQFGHLGGKHGVKGGRPKTPSKPPKGVTQGVTEITPLKPPKGDMAKPPDVTPEEIRREEIRGETVVSHSSNGTHLSVGKLAAVFEREMDALLGKARKNRYPGDPSKLKKPWQRQQLEDIVKRYQEDHVVMVIQRAVEDPWHNGKKDGTVRLGFMDVMGDFEGLLAKHSEKRVEEPKAPYTPWGRG